MVNAASSGTAGSPTYIDIPDGVYRETLTIASKSFLYLRPQNAGKVEIRATDKWTGWTDMGDGTWRSTNTLAALEVEDRWMFEEITPLTVEYPAGTNPTVINVASTARLSVGQFVNIGVNDNDCPVNTYEFRKITAKTGSTITIDSPLLNNHYTDPVAHGWHSTCFASVTYAEGTYPEQVYRNGPTERGGKTLRRVSGTPQADDFALDGSRRVILGSDPTGHVIEVTTRDNCVLLGTGANDITIDGLSLLYAGFRGIDFSTRTRPTLTKCEVAYSHTRGIQIGQSIDGVVSYCHTHHNGQLGASHNNTTCTLTDSELSYNNWKFFRTSWEAGGIKLSTPLGATLARNNSHHNRGHGIWIDIERPVQNVTMDGDRVHHNATQGIRIEASHGVTGTGLIVYENGFGFDHDKLEDWNIQISGSYDVTLDSCVIAWGGSGAVQIIPQGSAGREDVHDVHVNNSLIVMEENDTTPFAMRWSNSGGNPSIWLPSQLNFNSSNRYGFTDASGIIIPETPTGTPTQRYRWNDVHYHRVAEYNATDGESDSTVFTLQADLEAALGAARVALTPEPLDGEPPPEPEIFTTTFGEGTGLLSDGQASVTDLTTWPPISTPASSDTGTAQTLAKNWTGTQYVARVLLFRWDTSSIPDAATITDVKFKFYCTSRLTVDGASFTLGAKWFNTWDGTAAGEYEFAPAPSDALSGVALSTITSNAENTLTLLGPSQVNKSGNTGLKLFLEGASTPLGNNSITVRTLDDTTTTADEPRLVVTYEV